jgi:outer membrane protein OmpA-like peptidoglycan-associated protein
MRRSVLRGLGAAAVLISAAQGTRAQLAEQIVDQIKAGVPVVGADVGASIPIGNFQETAKPGGAIAPFVGYQIGDGSWNGFTFTPILQPQFAGFQSCCGDSIASITSITAGARFSLIDTDSEAYFGAQGGYYWFTNGPLEHHSGNGFNIEGGYYYEFWRGTALGLFIRYDSANMHPEVNTTSDITTFLVTGFEVRHRFLPPPAAPPPPAAVAEAPPVPPPAVKKKLVLRGVNFDFNKYNIRPDAAPILDEAAKTLQEAGEVTVSVDGYTDSIGSDGYNQRLSMQRANAVKAYLEAHGVAASRLTAKGFGKSDPVANNATAEGRAQNRRVELIVNP